MTVEHQGQLGSDPAKPPRAESPGFATAKPGRRSPILAVLCVISGLLTIIVGFVVYGFSAAFSNATASGTGAAGMCVGLWMVLAARGVARRRLSTFVGLSLAWAWLIGRVVFDFQATVVTVAVLAPMVLGPSVGVGLVWVILLFFAGLAGLFRTIGAYRCWRREPAPQGSRRRIRPVLSLGIRLGLLMVVTLLVPPLIWLEREHTIAELAQQYKQLHRGDGQRAKFGVCSVVFLGYELTRHEAEKAKTEERRVAIHERTLADAIADLESIAAAGAGYVRIGASGDHLFLANGAQEELDDRYMDAVRRTGIPVVLVDCQHPQALGKRLGWDEFCRFQRSRIEYYQRRYHPDVYIVACEPLTYHQFTLLPEATFSADAWAAQLSDVCRLVKSIDPTTRTGITVLVMEGKQPEWDVWTKMRNLPELDILSVEVYMPENFRQAQERLEEYRHPSETGKAFWIAETYNGWALCGRRQWDQDVAWLHVADDFARVVDAETVLVWSFGSFVDGGNFWDFVKGNLHVSWEASGELSVVGRGFAELQR